MAEILGSAVANESVSRIFSIISGNPRERGDAEDNAERLEFAVLKIHCVVAVSEDWQILHQPLLNWKARLKRVAKEGDGILRAYQRISMEHQRNEGTTTRLQAFSSARSRIARAAKRFMPFGRGEDDDAEQISYATVRRFERLAGVADEFFRYVRFGGRPRSLIMVSSFKAPTETLLAGKTLEYSLCNGSKDAFLLLHPCGDDGGRNEIYLLLSYEDTTTWVRNLKLCVEFQLRDHTDDILDIVMASLDLLPPQFGAARLITREFARELLTHERSCSPNPSPMCMWSLSAARSYSRTSTDKGDAAIGGVKPQLPLPLPILRVDAGYFTSRSNDSSDTSADEDDVPLLLACHIAPHLVPETYSQHYNQIEPEALQELLPKVRNEGQEPACEGNWWCPRTSTYLSVGPKFPVPPPTLKQLYLMENPETSV